MHSDSLTLGSLCSLAYSPRFYIGDFEHREWLSVFDPFDGSLKKNIRHSSAWLPNPQALVSSIQTVYFTSYQAYRLAGIYYQKIFIAIYC